MIERVVHAADPSVEVAEMVSFYRHGWHSWSPTGWVDPADPVTPIPDEGRRLGHDDPTTAFETRVSGSGVGVALDVDGTATLLGALAPDARVRPDGGSLVGSSEAGDIAWLIAEGSVAEVFATYARRLGEALGIRSRRRVRVWCSWYSYYEDITEAGMAEELAAIGDLPFDVIQIDDGWQVAIGDWEANDDFPSGMAEAARRISDTGRTAGLWLAPYIARADSRLVAERPELLLRHPDGAPVVSGINWGGPYYSLDPTSAATDAFVTEVVERARSWGFGYLKLDFLYAAGFPGVHERAMPRESAYRHGLETIRTAAGDDCYLLACGSPVISSIGIVDGIRIGPDVAEFWEEPELTAMGDYSGRGARNAIITTSERLWLRDIVDVDPDVSYFDRSAVDLDERTLGALRDLADVCGFVGTSERIGDLEADEIRELTTLLNRRPRVRRTSWLGWEVDDRAIDLAWAQRTPTSTTGRTAS